jgi:MraZ protein
LFNEPKELMPTEPPAVPFYSGTYERAIDAKKRAAVPSAWIKGSESEFYVIPHPQDGYLMVMPPEEFHSTEQRIMASGATAQEKRQAIRRFFSEAHKVTTDKQGRVLIPDTHAAAADLKAEIVIVGAGRRFEIWSKQRHEADVSANTGIYQRVAVEIGL